MEGHLHGIILLAILLTCLVILWRRGRQPQLAFPIFTITLAIPIVAANVLAFAFILVFPHYGILDEHPVSDRLITFLTHQVSLLLSCLVMLLYGLQWTPRGKRLLIGAFLIVCVLAGWHFTRLSEIDRYQATGIMMMSRREKAQCTPDGPCPSFVWHTWMSGLAWDPDPRPYMAHQRQLARALLMYQQSSSTETATSAINEITFPEPEQPREAWSDLRVKALRFPPSLHNARLQASLNAVGLLLVIAFTLTILILTPWRSIRWREEKWRFAFALALCLLLIMDTSHVGGGSFSYFSPSAVTQWLIPSLCLGFLGAVLKASLRMHASVIIIALVLTLGLNFQAMQLYEGKLGSGVFTAEYIDHGATRVEPVDAWHSWFTGIRFEGKRYSDY